MSYTVLLVDDEVELLSVLDTFLKDLGYNTITASSGNNAFNLFQSSLVDFVISDIQMSDGNGVDLLKNCSALNQDIPFLLVSGFVDIHLDELKKIWMH